MFQPLRSVSKLGLRTSVGLTVTWVVAVEDLPDGVCDRHGDGVGAGADVGVGGGRAGLGPDDRGAVAEVEPVAGDRGLVGVGRGGGVGADR